MLRSMKWSLAFALTAVMLATPAVVMKAEPADPEPPVIVEAKKPVIPETQMDVVETAVNAGSFKTLASALRAAGLIDTLKDKGPFTVMAPTDEAFSKLPAGTVEMLLKSENKAKLKAILTYHVIADNILAADIAKLRSVKTVNGASLRITTDGDIVMVDGVKVTKTDINCTNGVIHAIDTVLMPKE